MKRSLLLAAAALILASCAPKRATEPIEGLVRVHDERGRIERIHRYQAGLLQGLSVGYFPSGAVAWKVNYDQGKKHGVQRVYHENGNLKSESPFIKGEIHGTLCQYDEAGRLVAEIPVKGGHISGEIARYRYDNEMRLERPRFRVEDRPIEELVAPKRKVRAPKPAPEAEERDDLLDADQTVLADAVQAAALDGEFIPTERLWESRRKTSSVQGEDAEVDAKDLPVVARRSSATPYDEIEMNESSAMLEDQAAREGGWSRVRLLEAALPLRDDSAPSGVRAATPVTRMSVLPVDPNPATRARTSRSQTMESQLRRDAETPVIYADDAETLDREFLVRKYERTRTSQNAEVFSRPLPSGGKEYLVFPGGGSRATEAWRYEMLKRGLDPDAAVRQGGSY